MNPRLRLVAGAIAGICSVTFTYPLDMVRTRLSLPGPQGSIFSTTREIYKNEGGIFALYRGIIPTVTVVIINSRESHHMSQSILLATKHSKYIYYDLYRQMNSEY